MQSLVRGSASLGEPLLNEQTVKKGKYLTFEGIQLFVPIMKRSETTDSEICLLLWKFLFWTNETLMVINISNVWKTFLVVTFHSVWYFGSAWLFPPSHSQLFFFFRSDFYYVFDRKMSTILMGESYVSCNHEQPVTHRCVFVLQTKIYTNGTAQCQWSTVRRSRLWQIEAGMCIMLLKRLLSKLDIRTCSCPISIFHCSVSQFQTWWFSNY